MKPLIGKFYHDETGNPRLPFVLGPMNRRDLPRAGEDGPNQNAVKDSGRNVAGGKPERRQSGTLVKSAPAPNPPNYLGQDENDDDYY